MIAVDLCLDGSVLFGISILTTYHFWCISSNTTTIESWEKDRILTIIRRGKIREVSLVSVTLRLFLSLCCSFCERRVVYSSMVFNVILSVGIFSVENVNFTGH